MDPALFQRASDVVNSWEEVGCAEPITLAYKSFGDQKCFIDVYMPDNKSSERAAAARVPIVVYFHGGGMTVGNRRCWFPTWMLRRAVKAGYGFISADYRLMPTASGHDILEDIHDLFRFLDQDLGAHCKVDSSAIVVAGSSAGAFCAYIAALHAKPKPVAVLSMYGMGGDVLIPQYLSIRTEPFFMGREILDIKTFRPYLFPFPPGSTHTADSRLAYDPETGIPSNPRMPLCRILLQEGIWLDYWTGDYDELDEDERVIKDGFSRRIRKVIDFGETNKAHLRALIPSKNLHLFPQFNVTSDFPPTFLVHGEVDSAVMKQESENMKALLDGAGVEAHLRIVPGQEHSFEYALDPESQFGELFDEIFAFISRVLT